MDCCAIDRGIVSAERDGFFGLNNPPYGAIDLVLAQLGWTDSPVVSFAASYLPPKGMPPRGFDRTEVFGTGRSWQISCAQVAASHEILPGRQDPLRNAVS